MQARDRRQAITMIPEKMAVVKMEATAVKTKRTKQSWQGQDRDKAGARVLAEEWGSEFGETEVEKKRGEQGEEIRGVASQGEGTLGPERWADMGRAGPSQGGGRQRKKSGQCEQHSGALNIAGSGSPARPMAAPQKHPKPRTPNLFFEPLRWVVTLVAIVGKASHPAARFVIDF